MECRLCEGNLPTLQMYEMTSLKGQEENALALKLWIWSLSD